MNFDFNRMLYEFEPGEVAVVHGLTVRNLNAEPKLITMEFLANYAGEGIVEGVEISPMRVEKQQRRRRAVEI